MMRSVFVLLTLCSVAFAAKQDPVWQSGTVLSQDISSERAGAYSAPVGNATVAVPLYRRSSQVTVETERYVYQWVEVGPKPLVLPVHDQVRFYQKGSDFIVLDNASHKHRFVLVGMTAKNH